MTEEQQEADTSSNGARRAHRSWPNTMGATGMTGLSRKKLEELAANGVLYREKASDGTIRWDPAMLALVAEAQPDDSDEPKSTLSAETVALLRQAHGHLENTLRLVVAPSQALLDRALAENERLRARVTALESVRDSLAAEREKVLSELHLREMLTLEVQQSNRRKDQALELARSAVPKLLEAVNPESKAVVGLVQSLTAEQRGLLLETDMLNEEQKTLVRRLLEKAPAGPAAAPEGEGAK